MREQIQTLLSEAAASRMDPKEKEALESARAQLEAGMSLDMVVASLPHLRYAKGLLVALGWAAEMEDAQDPAWKREAQEECQKAIKHYRQVLPPSHGVSINGKVCDITP